MSPTSPTSWPVRTGFVRSSAGRAAAQVHEDVVAALGRRRRPRRSRPAPPGWYRAALDEPAPRRHDRRSLTPRPGHGPGGGGPRAAQPRSASPLLPQFEAPGQREARGRDSRAPRCCSPPGPGEGAVRRCGAGSGPRGGPPPLVPVMGIEYAAGRALARSQARDERAVAPRRHVDAHARGAPPRPGRTAAAPLARRETGACGGGRTDVQQGSPARGAPHPRAPSRVSSPGASWHAGVARGRCPAIAADTRPAARERHGRRAPPAHARRFCLGSGRIR